MLCLIFGISLIICFCVVDLVVMKLMILFSVVIWNWLLYVVLCSLGRCLWVCRVFGLVRVKFLVN